MPAVVVGITFRKGSDMSMDKLSSLSVHCFVGFRGNAIQARTFSVLQLVDVSINFSKGDGGVDVVEDGVLRDIFENGSVNGSVIVEDAVEVRSKDCHVFFAIGCKLPICHLHGHLYFLFVMGSVSFGKEAYVFPCNTWVGVHVVDLGT